MEHYKEIRRQIYSVQFKRWKHILNIKAPYSLMKGIYYIETASLFLFLTQKIIKSPNFLTFLYILTGVGAFLIILSPQNCFLSWIIYGLQKELLIGLTGPWRVG